MATAEAPGRAAWGQNINYNKKGGPRVATWGPEAGGEPEGAPRGPHELATKKRGPGVAPGACEDAENRKRDPRGPAEGGREWKGSQTEPHRKKVYKNVSFSFFIMFICHRRV